MSDLEKLERKLNRIENKIDSLKEEIDNMPERWVNKRAEKKEELSELRSEKRSLKKEIAELENDRSYQSDEAEKKDKSSSYVPNSRKKSTNYEKKQRNSNDFTSRTEGDWSIRIYDSGYSTAKNGSVFLKAGSESELMEKIHDFDENQHEQHKSNPYKTIENEYEKNGWNVRLYADGHATAKKGSTLLKANTEEELLEKIQATEDYHSSNPYKMIENEYEKNGWNIRIYADGHATAKKNKEIKKAESESEILDMIQGDNDTEEIEWGRTATIGSTPAAEVGCCPNSNCGAFNLQENAIREESENIFIFKCSECGKIFKAELNNIECLNCHRLMKKTNRKFCSMDCYSEYNGIRPEPEPDFPFPYVNVCNCVFYRNGVCKNDENPYYYDQDCPGDCDYYYRK